MSLQIRRTAFEWLSRRISLSGFMSRRDAEHAISNGFVKVDGYTVTKNIEVCAETEVEVKGIPIPSPGIPRLYGIYKERKVLCSWDEKEDICTLRDLVFGNTDNKVSKNHSKNDSNCSTNSGRLTDNNNIIISNGNTNFNCINNADECSNDSKKKIKFPVMNYDEDSDQITFLENLIIIHKLDVGCEGIVLLTNDGEFSYSLMNHQNRILSTFLLRVHGKMPFDDLRSLRNGAHVNGVDYGPVWVEVIRRCWTSCWIKVTYVESKDRDLHSLFNKFNLEIKRFKRYSYGPYRGTAIPRRTLMPLKIHKSLKHLIPLREKKLSLVPTTESLLQNKCQNFYFSKSKVCLKDSIFLNNISSEPDKLAANTVQEAILDIQPNITRNCNDIISNATYSDSCLNKTICDTSSSNMPKTLRKTMTKVLNNSYRTSLISANSSKNQNVSSCIDEKKPNYTNYNLPNIYKQLIYDAN